jgi:hypothetical protein
MLNFRILLLLVLLLSAASLADSVEETQSVDAPLLRLQEKADNLYRRGHFERAYAIYVNDLAAAGDKHSQYMAGYMCLNGKGVPRDPVKALAWFRLAAERDYPEFVEVRDDLIESTDEKSLQASDAAYVALRKEYSDMALALGHLRSERQLRLTPTTGSHLSGGASSITIIDPGSGMTITRSEYVRRVEARMRMRLDYITDALDIEPIEPDMSDAAFEELVARVTAHLEIIDDR